MDQNELSFFPNVSSPLGDYDLVCCYIIQVYELHSFVTFTGKLIFLAYIFVSLHFILYSRNRLFYCLAQRTEKGIIRFNLPLVCKFAYLIGSVYFHAFESENET